MPWEVTDKYIRSGHGSASSQCRTITLSAPQGIKAIYCKSGDKWGITSYLFSRAKGWTISKAKTWFSKHHEKIHESLNTRTFHYDFTRIYNNFLKQFGQEEGEMKFKYFVSANGLDPSKKYHPLVQFHESFQWVKPLIYYIKQDKEAKYYGITCITANISMNNKNYTPEMLESGAVSMNYRPINLNHDHSKWLPFPRTRIEWAKFEENSLEGLCRVDNRDKWLQDKLDNHDIIHPSIEGRPIPPDMGGGFHFTALALLEKGKELPGDPLTGIQPIMLNENLYESIGKLVEGEDCLTCYGDDSIMENTITEESARTDDERAMNHFNISQEEWNKMSPEEKEKCIKKLPKRGSGQSTEAELDTQNTEILSEGGENLTENEETTENHLSSEPLSDNGRYTMSKETEQTQTEEELTREDNLKVIELETTNKMLQTEMDDITKKYRENKLKAAEKIAELELEIAKLQEKTSVVEGLKTKVGDQTTKFIEQEKLITKKDEIIKNQKIDYEALETLIAKKDKLIENYRDEIKETEQRVKEAKAKQVTSEANMRKMVIDKEAAERRALEAESERNKYSEKYSEAFDMANKAVQEKNVTLKKMHAVQEENAALREQARIDGVTIERLKRDAKIQEKRATKAEKERNETLNKLGVFDKNEDGTVTVGDVNLKF